MQEARSPESCMTHQEMPLLPWQHLGFLEGSPARERSSWAPWCHQCWQGTELGSPDLRVTRTWPGSLTVKSSVRCH